MAVAHLMFASKADSAEERGKQALVLWEHTLCLASGGGAAASAQRAAAALLMVCS